MAIASTVSGNAARDGLDEISRQLELIQKQRGRQIQEFRKDTRDVKIDNKLTARDIGILKKDDSRLNVFSSLSVGDEADVFSFRVSTTGNAKIGSLVSRQEDKDAVRIQVFSKTTGKLIADNDVKAGDARAAYVSLAEGKFELAKGEYILRLSRIAGVDRSLKQGIQYAVQISQGVFSKDFDTVERGARPGDNPFGLGSVSIGTSQLLNGLSSGSNFISNLPKIGTKATYKLSGAIYDSLF